jgi:hypothetical protein
MTTLTLRDMGFLGGGLTLTEIESYIARVEAADGQALESGVKAAYTAFVDGCKSDGIWTAIKACCIMAGARTLAGALVPLVGLAPTRNGTEAGWNYSRKLGLSGNGTNNYLNTNTAGNSNPLNNVHLSVFKNDTISATNPYFIGISGSGSASIGQQGIYLNSSGYIGSPTQPGAVSSALGLHGAARSSSSSIVIKRPSVSATSYSLNSTSASSAAHFIYTVNSSGSPASVFTTSRLSFYSIGESLDLALLDSRVTTLMNAISAAIP